MADNNNRQREERNNNGIWAAAATVAGAAGVAALAGGLYWLIKKTEPNKSSTSVPMKTPINPLQQTTYQGATNSSSSENSSNMSSYLTNLLQNMDIQQNTKNKRTSSVPDNPVISNLNGLLSDIYSRFIALTDDERTHHYNVFTKIFGCLQEAMKEVDPYYRKYSSTVQFAGSHYDKLRIKKEDDFPDKDVDIVIGLPLNFKQNPLNPEESDIVFEAKSAGYIQLKMGVQFKRLLMRDGHEWLTNKTAYEWKDERNYLLRSKFIDWFKSVVNKALNRFGLNVEGRRFLYVEGVQYTIRTSESGPAVTLIIENRSKGFKLDVDLVPALRFPEDRWPICRGYRSIPVGCNKEFWMVVPKPNKSASNGYDTSRSWRIALHDQERKLMHDTNNMRQAISFLLLYYAALFFSRLEDIKWFQNL